ncbi:MAG: InlB B-repeat-containing protein [Lachnospiraceae bacterium]|nr:InlB B-repeat-containing protein [Lachnospiraceae bacterium]
MKRLNNKGITLVELLISIGIFAVVMVAVFNILRIANKTYTKGATETSVQNEAQSLMGHLENIISSASTDVKWGNAVTGINTLLICYEDYYSVLWYDSTRHELYYAVADGTVDSFKAGDDYKDGKNSEKYNLAADEFSKAYGDSKVYNPNKSDTATQKAQFLLAENIVSFAVTEINKISNYVGVSFTITDDGGKTGVGKTSFTASKNIKLRNNLSQRSSVTNTSSSSPSSSSSVAYTMTWKNYDGTVLTTTKVAKDKQITQPKTINPTKPSDEQYKYVFKGWGEVLGLATEDKEFTAQFDQVDKSTIVTYTMKWYNYDGSLITSTTVEEGDKIIPPTDPTRESDDTNNYTFTGWDPTVPNTASAPKEFTAQYSATPKQTQAPEDCANIYWYDADGNLFKTTKVVRNTEEIIAPSETPSKEGYVFWKWVNQYGNDFQSGTHTYDDMTYRAILKPAYTSFTYVIKLKGTPNSGGGLNIYVGQNGSKVQVEWGKNFSIDSSGNAKIEYTKDTSSGYEPLQESEVASITQTWNASGPTQIVSVTVKKN